MAGFPFWKLSLRIRGETRVPFIKNNTAAGQIESRPGLRNLLCGAGNFGKMGSAVRQRELRYTE